MPFEPLDGRRYAPAPQGTALVGTGDMGEEWDVGAAAAESLRRFRAGITVPLPGASPMSSGKLMVDPTRAAALPMALADMVRRIVTDAAEGWSEGYDKAAAGEPPREYASDVFRAAGVATAGGYARAGIGLGSAGGKLPSPQGLLTWAKQQPEFEKLTERYYQQLINIKRTELDPAKQTFIRASESAGDPGAAWRNMQDADRVIRLSMAVKPSDLGAAAEKMAAETLWSRVSGGPELGSAGGRLGPYTGGNVRSQYLPDEFINKHLSADREGSITVLYERFKQEHPDATMTLPTFRANVKEVESTMRRGDFESFKAGETGGAAPASLTKSSRGAPSEGAASGAIGIGDVIATARELGLRAEVGSQSRSGTTYIKIFDPSGPKSKAVEVRVPSTHDPHGGSVRSWHIDTSEMGTRNVTLSHRNIAGESYEGNLDAIRERLAYAFGKELPSASAAAPAGEAAVTNPDQLRLLSSGVPVASLGETPEKPPPPLKIPASRWWERMEPDSPSSQPRREQPPIRRPRNPNAVRVAGVDDDEWEVFESMSAFARSLDPGFTSIPEDGETARERPPAPATRMNLGMGVPRPEQAGAPLAHKTVFAGERSLTADTASLAEAKELDGKSDPKEIWKATGWFKGADGKWRSEVDDSKSQLLIVPNQGMEAEHTLKDVLSHSDLYAAYPELQDIPVVFINDRGKRYQARYQDPNVTRGEAIYINTSHFWGSLQWHAAVLHEIQHAVQHREGTLTKFRNVFVPYDEKTFEKEAFDVESRFFRRERKAAPAALEK